MVSAAKPLLSNSCGRQVRVLHSALNIRIKIFRKTIQKSWDFREDFLEDFRKSETLNCRQSKYSALTIMAPVLARDTKWWTALLLLRRAACAMSGASDVAIIQILISCNLRQWFLLFSL